MPKLKLFYHHDERRIVDQDGKEITYERARELWETFKLTDYNLALHTLSINNWDSDKVTAHYAEMEKQR